MIIQARERDLGGFSVRRLLPAPRHRMVGPFIFLDHMGPATLTAGKGMDVRPHPHIGLATVTYLFEGTIHHRDSLGSSQYIEPGAINWMTAGRGIVHSERTPAALRHQEMKMNGLQCWVALPLEHEETAPQFAHHPMQSLPQFKIDGIKLKLLAGSAFGYQSPVAVLSELFYLEAHLKQGQTFNLEMPAGQESAVYLLSGQLQIEDEIIPESALVVARKNQSLKMKAITDCHLMFLGGQPVGERFIWWNLVSSTEKKIAEAKADWILGPRPDSPRFHPIPGDDKEFTPAPES